MTEDQLDKLYTEIENVFKQTCLSIPVCKSPDEILKLAFQEDLYEWKSDKPWVDNIQVAGVIATFHSEIPRKLIAQVDVVVSVILDAQGMLTNPTGYNPAGFITDNFPVMMSGIILPVGRLTTEEAFFNIHFDERLYKESGEIHLVSRWELELE